MKLIKFENKKENETRFNPDYLITMGFKFYEKKIDSFYFIINSIFKKEREYVDSYTFEKKIGFGFNRYGFMLRKFKIIKVKSFFPIMELIKPAEWKKTNYETDLKR